MTPSFQESLYCLCLHSEEQSQWQTTPQSSQYIFSALLTCITLQSEFHDTCTSLRPFTDNIALPKAALKLTLLLTLAQSPVNTPWLFHPSEPPWNGHDQNLSPGSYRAPRSPPFARMVLIDFTVMCHPLVTASLPARIYPRPVRQFHPEDSIYISSTEGVAREFPALPGRALI